MAPSEIAAVVDAQPFEPFRIVMSSGSTYYVDAPHRLLVGNRFVHLGIPSNPGERFVERAIRLDLLHVTEVISLAGPSKPPQSNGTVPASEWKAPGNQSRGRGGRRLWRV